MTGWREELKAFKQSLLERELALCSQRQQAFFHKLFPKGPNPSQYESAMDLIARTRANNEKHRRTVTEVDLGPLK